jgi:hypothetical protein
MTWRCFFCDEVFTSREAAWLHFAPKAMRSIPSRRLRASSSHD